MMLVNKEIDKLCSISREGLAAKRPRYHEHAFVLLVLREADKTVLKKKAELENSQLNWCQRTRAYIYHGLHKSFQRLTEYMVTTVRSFLPIPIPNNAISDAISGFLKTLEASFEDQKYIESIANTGSFARPDTSMVAFGINQLMDDEMVDNDDEIVGDEENSGNNGSALVEAFDLNHDILQETFDEIHKKMVKKLIQLIFGLDWGTDI